MVVRGPPYGSRIGWPSRTRRLYGGTVVDGELARCTVVDATDARRDVTCRTRTFADLQSTATPYSSRQSTVIYFVCTANLSAWRHLILLFARCEVTRARLSVLYVQQYRVKHGWAGAPVIPVNYLIPSSALILAMRQGSATRHIGHRLGEISAPENRVGP